jgi:hypothetical protein
VSGQIEILTTIIITDPVTGKARDPETYRAVITGLTAIEDKVYAISADGTKIIWDPTTDATEAVSDFDIAILIADGVLDLEGDIDSAGDVGREQLSARLIKNLPLMLGADDAYANHSAGNAYGGTLDLIERLRVDEPNSTARNLRAILAT